MDDVDLVDAAAFATSDNEALLMDPQQRMLLECSAEAIWQSNARHEARDLTQAGVFVVSVRSGRSYPCLPRLSRSTHAPGVATLCSAGHHFH